VAALEPLGDFGTHIFGSFLAGISVRGRDVLGMVWEVKIGELVLRMLLRSQAVELMKLLKWCSIV
jgi:hypothetical protein